MGRGSDLVDELLEEAPRGAANALGIMLWVTAAILAGLVLILLIVVLFVFL